ncbi:MAG: hypothetical protein ACKVZ0_19145 [Gemmatimonadales bacterium]
MLLVMPLTAYGQSLDKPVVQKTSAVVGTPPSNLRALPSPTSIRLTWTCPSGATGYEIFSGANGGTPVRLATTTLQCHQDLSPQLNVDPRLPAPAPVYISSYDHAGLAPATAFVYVVRALYPDGYSDTGPLTTQTELLPAPTGIVIDLIGGRMARVGWKQVPGVSGYHVYRKLAGQSGFELVTTFGPVPPGSYEHLDMTYLPGGQHAYYVQAVGGAPSVAATVTLPPAISAEQLENGTVHLTWAPVSYAYSKPFYLVTGPPTNTPIRVDDNKLTVNKVPAGPATWQVTAMLQDGNAPPFTLGSFSTSLTVVRARYRLVAEAIRVASETADKPLSEDGVFDEVFVASFAERYLRPSPATGGGMTLVERQPVQVSHVHGDVANWLPSDRVQAGTASATGGVRARDVISPIWAAPSGNYLGGSPGFVLWEGELLPGKHDLLLRPTIWELDDTYSGGALSRNPNAGSCLYFLCSWPAIIAGAASFMAPAQAAMAGSQIAVIDGYKVGYVGSPSVVHLEKQSSDRPVGLQVDGTAPKHLGLTGDWYDKVVVLSSEKIEAALARGSNRIEVRYWDHWAVPNQAQTTVDYLNGDYTLVIRIERLP